MEPSTRRTAWVSLAALGAILLWDLSGLDLALARLSGGAGGFGLRDDWLLTHIFHTGGRYLAWLLVLGICLAVAWPPDLLRRLPPRRRLQLAVSALVAWLLITLLKSAGHTSCPWDLHQFGGVATFASHWTSWRTGDGGAGHCFPAGHATTGFAFVGGWFALREDRPRLARNWLLGAIAAGLLLGIAQQLRGAHFMSHTLWTGWLCWITGWLTDRLFVRHHACLVEVVS